MEWARRLDAGVEGTPIDAGRVAGNLSFRELLPTALRGVPSAKQPRSAAYTELGKGEPGV